jgi:hypothetical protein
LLKDRALIAQENEGHVKVMVMIMIFFAMIMTFTKKEHCDTKLLDGGFRRQILPSRLAKNIEGVEQISVMKQNIYICRPVCCITKIVGVFCFYNDHGHGKMFDNS